MAHFDLHIDSNRKLTKSPLIPWQVGHPGATVTIKLTNDDTERHRVRMSGFKHKESGNDKDPLTGTKVWIAFGNGGTRQTRHTVVDHQLYGAYSFDFDVDGGPADDPEIIVDEPPVILKPKKKKKYAKAAKKATAKKAKKAKSRKAKQTKAKRAKKATRARKTRKR